MSHFTVTVVGTEFGEDQVRELLEPFWELDLSAEEAAKDPRAVFDIEIPEEDLCVAWEKWQQERETDIQKALDDNKEIPSYYQVDYNTAEEWVEDWYGYSYVEGKGWGYWRNPKAKWDWYLIGGRWTGFYDLKLRAKEGFVGTPGLMTSRASAGSVDQARKKDIDWEAMRKRIALKAAKDWDELHKDKKEGKALAWLYDIKPEDTKESYVERLSRNPGSTFALLKDGQWYERGEMGWWGVVTDEKQKCDWGSEFEALLDEIPDDAVLTVVDCHI